MTARPAFAENDGWTAQHQMSVVGTFKGITRADCLRVAEVFDLREAQAAEIIDRVLDAVADWEPEAAGGPATPRPRGTSKDSRGYTVGVPRASSPRGTEESGTEERG